MVRGGTKVEQNNLTVGDVTRLALAMEEKGMNFYTWAAGRFDDAEVMAMFRRLAEEEWEHARTFSSLLSSPEAKDKISSSTGKYLKILADLGDVFPRHGEVSASRVKTPSDALAIGIQAEKDSILFYHELFNATDTTGVKNVLSKLLEEEKMHLLELRDSMDELSQ